MPPSALQVRFDKDGVGDRSGIGLALVDAVSSGTLAWLPLTPSPFRYPGSDGKTYPVNLWDAPAPTICVRLPGSGVLVASNADGLSEEWDADSPQNPIFCVVLNTETRAIESVMRGNFLSISRDPKNPVVVVVDSLLPHKGTGTKPFTSDPIFFYWRPGPADPRRFASARPYETVPHIAFPPGADGKNVHAIGGERLLCHPIWAPHKSRLAFAAYRTEGEEARFYVLDFSGTPLQTRTLPLPAKETGFVNALISKDGLGYLYASPTDGPVVAEWKDDTHVTFTFEGARSYPWKIE